MSQPDPNQNPFQASQQRPPAPQPDNVGDGTGGLIPYKNMHALVAYYLGVFSVIPCIGLFLGVAAVILGIIGLKKRNANPVIKGSAHAWIGIIVGGFFALVWGAAMVLMFAGAAMNAGR
jgi:hypothetical protein